jgi:hypothetical protein
MKRVANPTAWLCRPADRLKRWFTRDPEQPEDPYAYVMAPKKRPPNTRSAAAVAELDE